MTKISNVFNVGEHIRKNTKLKVSPSFVEEAKSDIEILLEDLVGEAIKIAEAEGMKTLQEKHLIRVNDFRIPERNKLIACNECGRSFVVQISDIRRKMCCPFCGKKKGIVTS